MFSSILDKFTFTPSFKRNIKRQRYAQWTMELKFRVVVRSFKIVKKPAKDYWQDFELFKMWSVVYIISI